MKMETIHEDWLRANIALDLDAVEVTGRAFAALAEGRADMPPILRLEVPEWNGEVDVKTAHVRGLEHFAIKVSPGFFDNPGLGLPSVSGLMLLHASRTGMLRAVFLDNGYLTDVRTAAAGAVAARHLAREDSQTVGVIGAGSQARLQARALRLVRDFRKVRVWARDGQKAKKCAEEISSLTGAECEAVDTPSDAVCDSDIVITATPSRSPVVKPEWLRPGVHVTAMGSDAEDKNELEGGVLERADLLVCDSRSQCMRLGELHHAVSSGILSGDVAVTELGRIVTGAEPGRTNEDQITVCDLTGTGVQDTMIADHAWSFFEKKTRKQ